MNSVNRVIFNTAVLYVKLIVGMFIGLFTTRLVLNALGEIDFGIYALVAGVIGMLGLLNSSMANASMRFMSYSMGSEDLEKIKKTFNTTLFLHFIIGAVIVLVIEIGGMMMFDYLLKIPVNRISDAKIVFHFMAVTTFVTIISVPYDAVINAHENLLALSLFDILGYVIKLGIAIFLTISTGNLLVLYGFFMLLTQILLRVMKQWYSRLKYAECRISLRNNLDRKLSKEILSFSGWNLFGNIASMSVTQVRGVLLNMFFGVTVNAADGVSKTASQQVNMVAVSMTRALNPQLVKSEGSGDRQRMLRLTGLATKYSLFLFSIFSIPVIFETEFLLKIWLKNVPVYAVEFTQLLLVCLFLDKFSFEIGSAIRAVGEIKYFQIFEMIPLLLTVPVSYIAFNYGAPPKTIFIISFFMGILVFGVRLYFGKFVANLVIKNFFVQGIIPNTLPILFSSITVIVVQTALLPSLLRLFFTVSLSIITLLFVFWKFGLKKEEKVQFKNLSVLFLSRVKQNIKKGK